MNTVTFPKKEYKNLIKRQAKVERELALLREVVRDELAGKTIHPSVMRRWDKISSSLDAGKGRSFASTGAMKKWLKAL